MSALHDFWQNVVGPSPNDPLPNGAPPADPEPAVPADLAESSPAPVEAIDRDGACELPANDDAGQQVCQVSDSDNTCEPPAEDDSGPHTCEMSDDDKAELEKANQKAEVLKRAHDLGLADGEAGKYPNPGPLAYWPEVQMPWNDPTEVVARTSLLQDLTKSYATGFGEGKEKYVKGAVAQKLKLTPDSLANASGQQTLKSAHEAYEKGFADGEAGKAAQPPQMDPMQPGRSEVLDAYDLGYQNGKEMPEAHDLGYEDGTLGQQYQRKTIEKKDVPEVVRLLGSYDRGYSEGQAAKKRAYDDGFADGKAGKDDTPGRRKYEEKPELGPSPLLDDYDQGLRAGWKEYAKDHPEPGFDLPWLPV